MLYNMLYYCILQPIFLFYHDANYYNHYYLFRLFQFSAQDRHYWRTTNSALSWCHSLSSRMITLIPIPTRPTGRKTWLPNRGPISKVGRIHSFLSSFRKPWALRWMLPDISLQVINFYGRAWSWKQRWLWPVFMNYTEDPRVPKKILLTYQLAQKPKKW